MTQAMHQILAVEDTYRHIENLVEAIRAETSNADILRRDRLLDSTDAGESYARQLAGLRSKTGLVLDQLRPLRPQPESKVFERLETSLGDYWGAVASEFQENPLKSKTASVRVQFASQSKKIFAVTEEIGKLNEENFESRRRELSRAVENLQNDIWETILTALCLGTIIAGASVFQLA